MVGTVTTADEAARYRWWPLGSREERIEAVVDTGFTGYLTWRPATVERLALPVIGSAESVLDDGSTVIEDLCPARVVWHGTPRPVRALVADAVPLLGMSLTPRQ